MTHHCKLKHRPMRLYVLAHGYVAVMFDLTDIEFFGGIVIPLAFGSEVSPSEAVKRMQHANPANRVSFCGGLQEYKAILAVNA